MNNLPPPMNALQQGLPLPPVQAQQVHVGGNPLLNNDPAINGIINLDIAHASEDPSTALLSVAAEKANCTVAELATRNFRLEKGFSPEKGNNDPIPIHAYSNPPGPDCYYLVRHWIVKVKDDQNNDVEMHFTKKIYTSVEVPRNLDGSAQKQQQYIAALAARTYAKIEESRMIVGAGGRSDLYNSIGPQMSKIARDRFVTLEMFNNAKNVTVNASNKKEIKDVTVDTIRLNFRAAKGGVEGEHEREGFYSILLAPNGVADQARKLKGKTYQFVGDNSSSAHVRKVAALLKTDDVLQEIANGRLPEEAFADAGLSIGEARATKEGIIESKVKNFYDDMQYFTDRSSVKNLMANHATNRFELPPEMLDKVAPERNFFKQLINKKPTELRALKYLEDLVINKNPNAAEIKNARMMLDATKKVYAKMDQEHKDITKMEDELDQMGIEVDLEPRIERDRILKKMNDLIEPLEETLPEAPIQPQALPQAQVLPPAQNLNAVDLNDLGDLVVSEEDQAVADNLVGVAPNNPVVNGIIPDVAASEELVLPPFPYVQPESANVEDGSDTSPDEGV